MGFVYAVPGIVILVEWLLAGILFALGWYRTRHGLQGFGDGLAAAGFVTALGGTGWLAWQAAPTPALVQSLLATGLALSTAVIYALVARQRPERLSAGVVLGFGVLVQVFAVGQLLWRGSQVPLPATVLPLWTALGTLTGLLGYGGLAVSALMILLAATLIRVSDRLSEEQRKAAKGLSTLERRSWRVALVALSLSVSIGLVRSWWGLGQVLVSGLSWSLVTWLLLAAGVYALTLGATRTRPARALLILACAVGIASLLTMAGSLN